MDQPSLPPDGKPSSVENSRFQTLGGLHLDDHKAESTGQPIRQSSLPAELVLPLRQHIGKPSTPLAAVGDKVLAGQLLANPGPGLSSPVHAPTSGTILAIEERPVPHPSGLSAPCIILKPDGENELRIPDSCPNPIKRDRSIVSECISKAGVVGLGGAVFPTYAKIQDDPNKPAHGSRLRHIDTVVLNAAECEPYITCDDMLMRERPEEILDGLRIIAHAFGTEQCVIGIEDNKLEAIEGLQRAIDGCQDGDVQRNVRVVVVPTLYPSGGERQIIKLVTGKEVPLGGLPLDIGVATFNVGTAAAVHRSLRKGQPLTTRIVTVTGAGVKNPCNIEAPIGTPIAHLIEQAGGYTEHAHRLIMGGPMMGFALADDSLPIVKGTNCILVASADEVADRPPAEPCIRCGFCANDCPANLLPQQLYWHTRANDFDKVREHHLKACIECGICAVVCPSHIPLVDYFRYAKAEIRNLDHQALMAEQTRERVEAREARLARAKAEREAKLAEKRKAARAAKAKKAELAPETHTPVGQDKSTEPRASRARPTTETTNDTTPAE